MRLEKTVEEMTKFIIEKKNNTPNFKWTSVNGNALGEILYMLDVEFFDRLMLHLERREKKLENEEYKISKKKNELEEREKALTEKEATTSYPFESSFFRDVYLMSEALKKEFTTRDRIDSNVSCRIIEMVENLIKEGGKHE
jgi:hypothetical protein